MKIKVSFFLRNTLRPFSDIYIFSFSSSCMEFHNWPLLRKWLLPLKKRKKCLKHKYTSFEFYHGKLFIYSSTYVLNWYKNKDFFFYLIYIYIHWTLYYFKKLDSGFWFALVYILYFHKKKLLQRLDFEPMK